MNANPILLQKKYSRVIECFAKQQGISLDAALDFFYHSEVYPLIRDGVSDMHCMSDAYLAEELEQEYRQNNARITPMALMLLIKRRKSARKLPACLARSSGIDIQEVRRIQCVMCLEFRIVLRLPDMEQFIW